MLTIALSATTTALALKMTSAAAANAREPILEIAMPQANQIALPDKPARPVNASRIAAMEP